MRFFFDACISHRVADAVSLLVPPKSDLEIHSLWKRYGRDGVPDPEWLGDLAKEGNWIILSADVAMQRSAVERKAWLQANLTSYFFVGLTNQARWEHAAMVMRWMSVIHAHAKTAEQGSAWKAPKGGNRLIPCGPKDWR